MSTRDALIQEILRQPEPLLRELHHYLTFLVERRENGTNGSTPSTVAARPAGSFEKTAGAFAGEPLERLPQLPFEKRQEW